MARGRRTWGDAPLWAWFAMAAGAIVLAAGLLIARGREEPSLGEPTRILVIGDSYTGGSGEGGVRSNSWAMLVGSDLSSRGYDVAIRTDASGGSGYVAPGQYNVTFSQLAERSVRSEDDLVVFFGSRNDTAPEEVVRAAAATAFGTVRTVAPDAALLVIGPPWIGDAPPANLPSDRDAVSKAAADVGAAFVDPLADRWFTGEAQNLIGSDGVHPTDEGHRYMADLIRPRLEEQLVLLGVAASPDA